MTTLLCAMMLVVGCTVVLFAEKTIGLLAIKKMYKLCTLVCRKIVKSAYINNGITYYEYIPNCCKHHLPSSKRGRDVFCPYSSLHRLDGLTQDKPCEDAGKSAVLGLFRASWIENCLLACKSRAKLIHDRGRLAPRLSGGIHLTTLTTR